jgi:hypothetical protein
VKQHNPVIVYELAGGVFFSLYYVVVFSEGFTADFFVLSAEGFCGLI